MKHLGLSLGQSLFELQAELPAFFNMTKAFTETEKCTECKWCIVFVFVS